MTARIPDTPGAPAWARTARGAALHVLTGMRPAAHDVRERLDRALTEHAMDPRDCHLCTELVYGVVKRRRTLDTVLRCLVTRRWDRVESDVRHLLRLGAYQMIFLDRIPASAATHQTVELAKAACRGGADRFCNAVLRRLARAVGPVVETGGDTRTIPLGAHRWRRLNIDVLPSRAARLAEYLGQAYSFPDWLIRRWLGHWPAVEVERWCVYFNTPPPLYLRVNTIKADPDQAVARCRTEGFRVSPGPLPLMMCFDGSGSPARLPGFDQGWCFVQDVTAAEIVQGLGVQPGQRVLDLCAAPGGKATHLAAIMGNQGEIVACDVSAARLEPLRENCRRLGVRIVRALQIRPGHDADVPAGPFDWVLLDVPCSNTGVLGRRVEARWRLRPGDFAELSRVQTALLGQAAKRIGTGGRIAYCTCSVDPEENGQCVQAFLHQHPDLDLVAQSWFLPGLDGDGGYVAQLQRRAEG